MAIAPLDWLAIIPDGNRTAARKFLGLDKLIPFSAAQIHEAYRTARTGIEHILTVAQEYRIPIVTIWILSQKNVANRPPHELEQLYKIFSEYLRDLQSDWLQRPENQDVRFIRIGRTDRLPQLSPELWEEMQKTEDMTNDRTGRLLMLAADYDGKPEFAEAQEQWKQANDDRSVQEFLQVPQKAPSFFQNPDGSFRMRNVSLIIRSGDPTATVSYDNEFLYPYRNETRFRRIPALRTITQDDVRAAFDDYLGTEQRRGA